MDDATMEILSRYIDGDLDPADEQEIAARLQSDAILKSRLEDHQSLRRSLNALAEREEIPAKLDSLVEHLRRGRPDPVTARPWVPWLATAAVVVLGLTVILEVNLRGSRQAGTEVPRSERGRRRAEPTERFSLAPLPTSSVPPEEQLLGVSERLLASPVSQMELDEPPALQVLGPLDVAPGEDDQAVGNIQGDDASATSGKAAVEIATVNRPSLPGDQSRRLQESPADRAPAEAGGAVSGDEKRARPSAPRRPWDGGVSTGQAQLFIFIGGKTSWQDFEPRARCDTGRYTVRIRIGGGVVREVWPVGGATSDTPSQRLCAGDLALGLVVTDVADGEYPAEVVVEPRGARSE